MKIIEFKERVGHLRNLTHNQLTKIIDQQNYEVFCKQEKKRYIYTLKMNGREISNCFKDIEVITQKFKDTFDLFIIPMVKIQMVETLRNIVSLPVRNLAKWQLKILETLEIAC